IMSASRVSCTHTPTSPCCRGATWAARALPATRGPGGCVSRWCPRLRSAWKLQGGAASPSARAKERRTRPSFRARLSCMSTPTSLRSIIDAAFERRAELSAKNLPRELDHALEECLTLLDSGQRSEEH